MNYVILQHVSAANEGRMSDFGFPRANEEWKTRGRKTITQHHKKREGSRSVSGLMRTA
jgi:hypothetical protein